MKSCMKATSPGAGNLVIVNVGQPDSGDTLKAELFGQEIVGSKGRCPGIQQWTLWITHSQGDDMSKAVQAARALGWGWEAML